MSLYTIDQKTVTAYFNGKNIRRASIESTEKHRVKRSQFTSADSRFKYTSPITLASATAQAHWQTLQR